MTVADVVSKRAKLFCQQQLTCWQVIVRERSLCSITFMWSGKEAIQTNSLNLVPGNPWEFLGIVRAAGICRPSDDAEVVYGKETVRL